MLWFVTLLVFVLAMIWFGHSMGWGPNDKRWMVLGWVLGLGTWGGIVAWAWSNGGLDAALEALGAIGLIFGMGVLGVLTDQYGIREGLTRLAVLAIVGLVVAAICEVEPAIGIGWVMLGVSVVLLAIARK